MDLGLERAGWRIAWQVEIDPHCSRVLERHWPDVPRFNDVRSVGPADLAPVDLIAGGFPCQDVSYAGHGAGLDGDRSGLWWEFARIIREMGPRFVLVENVPGLLDRGMGDVLGTLSDLGYDAEWSLVSACSVGATHTRQRLFIVAHSNRIDGRQGVRHTVARAFRPLQEVGDFASARAGALSRLADPSALYGGADGIPDGPQRNRAIGNAVAPDVAEWIGRRLLEATA